MNRTHLQTTALAFFASFTLGCAEDLPGDDAIPLDPATGKPTLGVELDVGKADSYDGYAGPLASGISSSTEAWAVTRRWYQVTAEAGIAWPANSGLTWDEKYAAWVQSMQKTADVNGGTTFELSTPWGKKLPAPKLECAETAMLLRAAFASWYNLPFFMAAWHPTHQKVYYGHFGAVLSTGARIPGSAAYKTAYRDHTAAMAGKTNAEILAAWPRDATLATRRLIGASDDDNGFLGAGKYTGAYLDEIFLNKRAAYLILKVLDNFASAHLADANRNMFNLAPADMRAGDVLLQRWQSSGIGHTVVVKSVLPLEGGRLDVEAVYGSMPRVQPHWYGVNIIKSYFTDETSGGPGTNEAGQRYAALGGGLKRWRTPVTKNGRWYNIVPAADRLRHVDATDLAKIEARTAELETLLGASSPEAERDALLAQIELARDNLAQRPASCTNRSRREAAFAKLYTLMADAFGMSKVEVDRSYRKLDDYVLAELEYTQSKTCCWNSTTAAMYEIAMAYNEARVHDEATGTCNAPVVLKASGGGYATFQQYAESIGRGAEWVAWRADESCPQAGVLEDREVAHGWTGFCAIADDLLGDGGGSGVGPTGGPCNGLTWEGVCEGNTVAWCDAGRVERYVCAAGERCAWQDDLDYYWCQ